MVSTCTPDRPDLDMIRRAVESDSVCHLSAIRDSIL